MYHMDANKTYEEKAWWHLQKNAVSYIEQVLHRSCTVTYHPSRNLSKLDEPDMQDTAGDVRANS